METKRVAIGELEGAALDFAVANAARNGAIHVRNGQVFVGLFKSPFRPTKNWSQCGPLIEQHITALNQSGCGWWAHSGNHLGEALSPLIASCRAIVASQNPSGYVDVPVELLNKKEGQ